MACRAAASAAQRRALTKSYVFAEEEFEDNGEDPLVAAAEAAGVGGGDSGQGVVRHCTTHAS